MPSPMLEFFLDRPRRTGENQLPICDKSRRLTWIIKGLSNDALPSSPLDKLKLSSRKPLLRMSANLLWLAISPGPKKGFLTLPWH